MSAEQSDDDLVERAATGDGAAFTTLVVRHQRRLLAMVSRMVGGRAAAEDIVQEVFTRAWIKAPSWRSRGKHGASYAAWLSRVALNLCMDTHRRARPAGPEALDHLPDEAPTADEALLRREAANRLTAAVTALPDRQRTAIGLFYDAELTNAEGAATIGVSVGAFELLLARAPGVARRRRGRKMDAREFAPLLDRFGGDLARWPEDVAARRRSCWADRRRPALRVR